MQRISTQPAPRPRQRGDVRDPPPPTPARIDPPGRVPVPFQQLRTTPPVIQPVHQLAHHLPVTTVPAPKQPQRQHEIHHQPGRQQPAPHLPGVGRGHDLIHQLRRERPGQRPHRHPVGQPAPRRHSLGPVMRHQKIIPGQDHHTQQPQPGVSRGTTTTHSEREDHRILTPSIICAALRQGLVQYPRRRRTLLEKSRDVGLRFRYCFLSGIAGLRRGCHGQTGRSSWRGPVR